MKTRYALLAAATLALACADNNASVEVFGICNPPDGCVFSSKCNAYALSMPMVDLSLTSGVYLYVQLNNQTPNNGDPSTGRANTNDAFVQEFEVDWKDSALPPEIGRIQFVVPAAGTSVTKIWILAPTSGAWDVAKVRFRGIYGDQSHFETAEFDIPVQTCSGCLSDQTACTSTCPPNVIGQLPLVCKTGA